MPKLPPEVEVRNLRKKIQEGKIQGIEVFVGCPRNMNHLE